MNVLRNAFRLRGSKVGINEQFPAEINERRKLLLPILKQEKSKGNPARLLVDALITPRAKFVVRGGKVVTDPSFTPRQWHKPQTRIIIQPQCPINTGIYHQTISDMATNTTDTTTDTTIGCEQRPSLESPDSH